MWMRVSATVRYGMDKVKFIFILLASLSFLFSCNDCYKIDEHFEFKDSSTLISTVKGIIEVSDSFLFMYGDVPRYIRFHRHIPKGNNYGIVKFTKFGMIDSNFKNPFNIPTSVHQMIGLRNRDLLVCYQHFKESLQKENLINIATMNNIGALKKISFDIHEILLRDTLNQELIRCSAIARDSSDNIYIAFSSIYENAIIPIIKLDSSFKIDKKFQNQIIDNFRIHQINQIQVQSDNKIIIGGNFKYTLNSIEYQNLCRIDQNGNIDEIFSKNFPKFEENDYNTIYTFKFIDSTIYIGGNFNINYFNDKFSDLIRLNQDGTMNLNQPNKNALFDFIDEEAYFNKSTIFAISEIEDSLLIVSGKFNRIASEKTDIPITILNKNGTITDLKFNCENEIHYINTIYFPNIDTIYLFGDYNMQIKSYKPYVRVVRRRCL